MTGITHHQSHSAHARPGDTGEMNSQDIPAAESIVNLGLTNAAESVVVFFEDTHHHQLLSSPTSVGLFFCAPPRRSKQRRVEVVRPFSAGLTVPSAPTLRLAWAGDPVY